ncbi:lipase [Melampsora larici-populina 98AG31]|uniref:Carboxylic ester hydrolase n=1 Tax=Melampsora larici-populina (strain 98AG31 / pathotype 3-4-7) TaxID=747676 RepID=F4S8C3_MELLP|nr:lipase [Melampsora larici-populina 98AG31]EGF99072.1 lipase [Melampsora larici-populina 98AG31]
MVSSLYFLFSLVGLQYASAATLPQPVATESHSRRSGLLGLGDVPVLGPLVDKTTSNLLPTDNQNARQVPSGTGSVKVVLDYGDFNGNTNNGVDQFYGIPYAEPPVGARRLTNPIFPLGKYPNFDATRTPSSCAQQVLTGGGNPLFDIASVVTDELDKLPIYAPGIGGQEDCLTLDILRPTGIQKGANLPVMFWIYPGDFAFGSSTLLQGNNWVEKSVALGQPVIFVAINHRMGAFGFLGGKQVGAAGVGNLGLKDQRLAMKWVQQHISEFGGDPAKVMLFGESSGSISISHHLFINNGDNEGLFRAAICESGSAFPVGTLAEGAGQTTYDAILKDIGCADKPDALACLRSVDFATLYAASNRLPGPFSGGSYPLAYAPYVDGEFVTGSMEDNLEAGKFARVSLITGAEDDEGTLLTLGVAPSILTESNLKKYLSRLVPKATQEQIEFVTKAYPQDPTQGSPFNTGLLNTLTPVFKQYAAIFGDVGFQGLRRLVSRQVNRHMPTWGYIDRGMKSTPILGSTHTVELLSTFGIIPGPRADDFQSRWIAFANNLDPNVPGLPRWENYGGPSGTDDFKGNVLQFQSSGSTGTIPDDFRSTQINYYLDNLKTFRLISA